MYKGSTVKKKKKKKNKSRARPEEVAHTDIKYSFQQLIKH